jgi:hypothetical protein
MHATDIVAYTFQAEQLTPEGLIEIMIARGEASPAARDMRVEDALDQIAAANGIDRYDEHTFDSEEFPKVIFASQLEEGETFRDADGEYVEL